MRGSAAAGLLCLLFRILPGTWMSVACECFVLSGRCLCAELITLLEVSYPVWCVPWVWLRSEEYQWASTFLLPKVYFTPNSHCSIQINQRHTKKEQASTENRTYNKNRKTRSIWALPLLAGGGGLERGLYRTFTSFWPAHFSNGRLGASHVQSGSDNQLADLTK